MFTFSFNHLNQLSYASLNVEELLEILNLQGLEVKKVLPFEGDTLITIEVKANRAFCLSYLGLLRELNAFKKQEEPHLFSNLAALNFDNAQFPVEIHVEAKSGCPYFAAAIIENINNKATTPKTIAHVLLASGINLVNPVVDILNFILLETGQPLHAYDLAKIKKGLTVRVNKHLRNIQTLNESEVTLPRGPLTVTDGKEVLAVAGVIGTKSAAVTEETTSVLIEAASFNPAAIRIAARALKIYTPSGFRFERGTDASQIKTVLSHCVKEITTIVGGHAKSHAFFFGKEEKKPLRFALFPKKINSILGLNLSADEIIQCLRQYFFTANNTKKGIEIIVPSYRLDIKSEIEVVGEVARIYGYHIIQPTLPTLPLSFKPNVLREKIHLIQDVLVGLGFFEVMNYSFIPQHALTSLGFPENQVTLSNPLSQEFALMRPTLAYSLMQSMAYNYSIGNKDLALFEIGKSYFRDSQSDTGHKENELLGMIFTGAHIARGFGLVKDIPYQFYDLSNFLSLLFAEMGLTYQFEKTTIPFLLAESSFTILVNDKPIGFCGQIDPDKWHVIPNGKLILTDSFYAEINLEPCSLLTKKIRSRHIFPPIIREYNFWIDKLRSVSDIIEPIQQAGSIVQSVLLKDIYEGKGLPADKKAVLVEVGYVDATKTLTADEVTNVEKRFLSVLERANVKLGQ